MFIEGFMTRISRVKYTWKEVKILYKYPKKFAQHMYE